MKLRKLQLSDAPYMLEWMKDENINQFFRFDSSKSTLDSVKKYIESSKDDETNKHFAIVDDSDEYMGTISLKNIDKVNSNAEYAISLRTQAQGTGLAMFATLAVLKYAFEKLELNRVYLNVLSMNKRAIAFYDKIGFTYEGEFRQHVLKDGELQDIKWYAFLKGDF